MAVKIKINKKNGLAGPMIVTDFFQIFLVTVKKYLTSVNEKFLSMVNIHLRESEILWNLAPIKSSEIGEKLNIFL